MDAGDGKRKNDEAAGEATVKKQKGEDVPMEVGHGKRKTEDEGETSMKETMKILRKLERIGEVAMVTNDEGVEDVGLYDAFEDLTALQEQPSMTAEGVKKMTKDWTQRW